MVTRRWMTPASSSRLILRQHGLEDRPTRSAISATERLASCWMRSSILASTASRTSDKFSSPSGALSARFVPRNPPAGARFWQAIAVILYDLLKPARGAEGRKLRRDATKRQSATSFCSSHAKIPIRTPHRPPILPPTFPEGPVMKTLKNSRPLSLHIPEPRFRPGETPDFSNLAIVEAGVTRRPPVDTEPKDMRELAYGLVRVLNTAGEAVGPWAPKIDVETLKRGLRTMMLTRVYDDRMYGAQRQGKTSFYMKCTGEEAVSIAQAMVLNHDDMCFPTYRQQGILLARGYPMVEMMNQVYSN